MSSRLEFWRAREASCEVALELAKRMVERLTQEEQAREFVEEVDNADNDEQRPQ